MAEKSSIEWTTSTWNPVTGCTKISDGCANCYAEKMAKRLKAMGNHNYKNGFQVSCHRDSLDIPIKWKKPRMIFVNSMSDIFHEDIPDEFILSIFEVMNKAKHHIYQILTKRSQRMMQIIPKIDLPDNIWMGVTVESSKYVDRIMHLKEIDAKIKFISFEPILDGMEDIDLSGIDWIIAGGESGVGARPIEELWIKEIRDKCISNNIPFFFKQWGGINKKKSGRELEGEYWTQFPNSR